MGGAKNMMNLMKNMNMNMDMLKGMMWNCAVCYCLLKKLDGSVFNFYHSSGLCNPDANPLLHNNGNNVYKECLNPVYVQTSVFSEINAYYFYINSLYVNGSKR